MKNLFTPSIELKQQSLKQSNRNFAERVNQILICYNTQTKQPIQLLKVNYILTAQPGMVIAKIEQNYQPNLSGQPIELEYMFCLDEKAAITQMIVELGDKKTYGIIKEKEEAKKDYEKGKQDGHTMAYSEKNDQFPEIKTVKIGCLQSKENLKITFEYIMMLFKHLNILYEISVEDAYQQYINDLSPSNPYLQRSRYIFFIDRSGSMSGQRIRKAKEALILFLKSLPLNSEFNIVSFGSSFSKMASHLMKYSSPSVDFALNYINQMEADFGGTDIFSALSSVIYYEEYKSNPDIPLNVFLLTDVEDEPSRIIDIVQKNTRPETRIYTLGIGQDCNQYLIKRVAEVGNGKHHFADNDDIDSKVIDLLEDSMTPYLKAIQLTTNVQQIHSIIPDPEQIINLRRNEELTIQVLFSSKQTNDNLKFEIKCFDPQLNKQLSHQCNVLLYNATYNEYFHKLSGHKLITLYENAQENNLDNVGIKFQYQNLTNLDIINTSIQYQILSSKTAFVGQVCKYEKEIVQEAEIQIGSLYSYVCLHCRSEVKQQQRDFKYLEIPNLSLKRISFEEFTKSSQPDGSFKLDGNIKLILKNVVHMVNKFSEQQSNTILALFYLELNFQDKKSSWKLILQKGIDYLKNQKLNYLILKQQYFDKFQELLNQ